MRHLLILPVGRFNPKKFKLQIDKTLKFNIVYHYLDNEAGRRAAEYLPEPKVCHFIWRQEGDREFDGILIFLDKDYYFPIPGSPVRWKRLMDPLTYTYIQRRKSGKLLFN